jgi:hypothetical protein
VLHERLDAVARFPVSALVEFALRDAQAHAFAIIARRAVE